MALKVTDVKALQSYIHGVMGRAGHHAPEVNEVCLVIAGAIVWRKDDQDIQVMERDGDTKNVLWVHINGTRYAFSYNHNQHTIEMKRDSVRGQVIKSFSNATTTKEVKDVFEGL